MGEGNVSSGTTSTCFPPGPGLEEEKGEQDYKDQQSTRKEQMPPLWKAANLRSPFQQHHPVLWAQLGPEVALLQ